MWSTHECNRIISRNGRKFVALASFKYQSARFETFDPKADDKLFLIF